MPIFLSILDVDLVQALGRFGRLQVTLRNPIPMPSVGWSVVWACGLPSWGLGEGIPPHFWRSGGAGVDLAAILRSKGHGHFTGCPVSP